jgi:hypothetical protein
MKVLDRFLDFGLLMMKHTLHPAGLIGGCV